MLWLKALHLIFMVTWFSGLFYLPRLFVYHSLSEDEPSVMRFKIMERKLYYGIMAPGALLTLFSGIGLLYAYGWAAYKGQGWLHLKLLLVFGLLAYHVYCGYLRKQFAAERNRHNHVFYRWLNEVPVLFLIAIIILVVVKPF